MKKFYLMIFTVVILAGMLAISGCKKNEEESELATTGELNGHAWVDLGLPSGILWATCNVGANTPEEYGDYFAWGETTPKDTYTWINYCFRTSGDSYDNAQFCKYNTKSSYGIVDNLTTLETSDDAAIANWDAGWRMPTEAEMSELFNNCAHVWTTQNGVNGRKFTGPNGNSIFLPAAGYRFDSELDVDGSYGLYWSSSLNTDNPRDALILSLYLGNCFADSGYRYSGFSVRPVCVSQN